MSDSAERVWVAMRTLVLEVSDRRAAAAAALGMSFVRVRALRRLARSPMTMRDLAAALSIDRPYTTVVVDDLEQRGLAERRPDGEDRRRKIVALTAEGRRLAREAEAILNVPPPQLAALPPDELATLDRILEAVVGAGGSR